jgi:hypothetical protein
VPGCGDQGTEKFSDALTIKTKQGGEEIRGKEDEEDIGACRFRDR